MNSKFLVWLLATIFLLAADLVRLKVDLIVVTGGPTALAAKGATSSIPMVMTIVGDPVGARFGCQSGAAVSQQRGQDS